MVSTKTGISCLHSTGLGKGWTFAFVNLRKIFVFVVSPFWRRKPCTGDQVHSVQSAAPACLVSRAASGAHSGSKPSAAAVPALLPRHTAPSCRRQDQPPGSAWDSTSGAIGHDQIMQTIIISSVPISPYSTRSLMMQCHIQVVTWSLDVTYQSNNRGKQQSGRNILPRAL